MGTVEQVIQLDRNLFFLINGWHSSFVDGVMYATSGKYTWIPLYLSVVYLFFRKWNRESIWIVVCALISIILSDQISSGVIKNLTHRLRPSHVAEWSSSIHLVRSYTGGLYGFVSSHAANSFAFATFTSLVLRNRMYTMIIFLWASFLSYSRIYLGVHYPLDVLGGALVGISLALLMFRLLIRIKPCVLVVAPAHRSEVLTPQIVIVVCLVLTFIYSLVLY